MKCCIVGFVCFFVFFGFFFLGGGATSQIKGGYVKYDKYCSAVDGSDVFNTLNQPCSLGERERERETDRQTDRQLLKESSYPYLVDEIQKMVCI